MRHFATIIFQNFRATNLFVLGKEKMIKTGSIKDPEYQKSTVKYK